MLKTGDKVSPRTLTTIEGRAVALPAAEGLVHLQFRRFAGCPICNLHMHEIASRHGEISEAGVTEVVVFHSDADRLRRYVTELPDFGDEPKASNEGTLEAIQMAWHEEYQDAHS